MEVGMCCYFSMLNAVGDVGCFFAMILVVSITHLTACYGRRLVFAHIKLIQASRQEDDHRSEYSTLLILHIILIQNTYSAPRFDPHQFLKSVLGQSSLVFQH